MKPYNIWLDEEDRRRIREVQERYHCESQSQAVRAALKIAAQTGKIDQLALPATSKHSRTKRTPRKATATKTLLRIAKYANAHADELPMLPADFSARPDFYAYGEYWQRGADKSPD